MKIDIITLFPELFEAFLGWSMIKKAQAIKATEINIHNLRDWAIDDYGSVDDRPYGGGPGMILRIEPIFKAIQTLKTKDSQIVLLSAKGETFNQKRAKKLAQEKHLILICGHYEGVDERVRQHLIDFDISIGNYILSGGELAAMVVTDAISRLQPKVLAKDHASEIESFSSGLKKMVSAKPTNPQAETANQLLEFPQYTRPENFAGWKVPKVLLSGNHEKINQWRIKKIKTAKND